MTLVELVLAIVKIAIVTGFALNMSALATWADRRQSAMVQHRVGPNRADINLPSYVVQGLLAGPGLLLGAAAAIGLGAAARPEAALERFALGMQLFVFVTWFNLTLLSWRVWRKGPLNPLEKLIGSAPPRAYFFAGIVAHAMMAILSAMVIRRFESGAMPPASSFVYARVAGGLLAGTMAVGGIYAATRVPKGIIPIRLAGTLHALADTVKMIWKEDLVPPKGDKLLHALAPLIAMFPALVVMAVIPFGDAMCFRDNGNGVFDFADLGRIAPAMSRDGVCEGHSVGMQVVDLNVGILYLFAISSTGVIGAAIAGWASDNKFSLLGGLRAASQMVSYEVAMGLSLMGLLLIYGTVRLGPMAEWQNLFAWGVFVQPLGFFMFLAATAAETKRVPFDAPEGESEIVAGYFVEYSGMKWGMFMAGEYVELITSSALIVALFFGGYTLPFLFDDGIEVALGTNVLFAYKMNHAAVTALQFVTFFAKTILMTFVQIFFRWTLPRFRYDQLMRFGWTKLLPLSIANLVITGVVVVAIDASGASILGGLKIAGQLTHFFVAFLIAAAPIALIWLMLRPTERTRFLGSSSARYELAKRAQAVVGAES